MMVLGRSQCREGGAENNGSGERKYCLAEHFYLLVAPILLLLSAMNAYRSYLFPAPVRSGEEDCGEYRQTS